MKEAADYITSFRHMGSRLGLERIEELLNMMDNPQNKLKFVHIAGTNGKGSTASMISQILIEANYKTGLFSSPVIKNFNEQFKINNSETTDKELNIITNYVKIFAEKMDDHPSEFEIITAVAFEYFYRNKCDIVVLEVGLGGRLDSTNIINSPEVSVITSIGLDHLNELGNTIEQIALEKSGIIKENSDVVFYDQDKKIEDIIFSQCSKNNTWFHKVDFNEIEINKADLNGGIFSVPKYKNIFIPLLGMHQMKNAYVALKTILVLKDKGFVISDSNIYEGFKNVKWPSRFEILNNNPLVILDGAHNPQCAETLSDNLKYYFKDKKIIFVIGVFKDKDYKKMIDYLIPLSKSFYITKSNNPRALEPIELSNYLSSKNINSKIFDDVSVCLKNVFENCNLDDVICINGTLSISGDVLTWFNR